MGAFALQGQKDFLHRVAHVAVSWIADLVCRNASPNAIAAAIATLSERKPGFIGITSRVSTAATPSPGAPADSRPNNRISEALYRWSRYARVPLVENRISRKSFRWRHCSN